MPHVPIVPEFTTQPPPPLPETTATAMAEPAISPPSGWTVGLAVICGVAFERAVSVGPPGLSATIVCLLAIASVFLAARHRSRSTVALLGSAVFFSVALAWRGSPWLVAVNGGLAIGLLVLGSSYASGGTWWRSSPTELFVRSLLWLANLGVAPGWMIAALRAGRSGTEAPDESVAGVESPWRVRAMGGVVAAPVVVVLVALLASADRRFGDLVNPSHWSDIAWSVVLAVGATWTVAMLARTAKGPFSAMAPSAWIGNASAGNVVLGSTAATFAVFAATSVTSLGTLEQRVQNSSGVTFSGEARAGFFQLVAVAMITLVVVLAVRVCCPVGIESSRQWQVRLIQVNCSLILLIVGSALARLIAYQEAFGWTVLRLYTMVSAVWLGVVFVIVAVATVRGRERSRWLTGAVVASAVVVAAGMNVVNPVGFVVASNLDRAAKSESAELDLAYILASAGDDGLPALAKRFGDLDAMHQVLVRSEVCGRDDTGGLWSFNWSRHKADDAAAAICG